MTDITISNGQCDHVGKLVSDFLLSNGGKHQGHLIASRVQEVLGDPIAIRHIGLMVLRKLQRMTGYNSMYMEGVNAYTYLGADGFSHVVPTRDSSAFGSIDAAISYHADHDSSCVVDHVPELMKMPSIRQCEMSGCKKMFKPKPWEKNPICPHCKWEHTK